MTTEYLAEHQGAQCRLFDSSEIDSERGKDLQAPVNGQLPSDDHCCGASIRLARLEIPAALDRDQSVDRVCEDRLSDLVDDGSSHDEVGLMISFAYLITPIR